MTRPAAESECDHVCVTATTTTFPRVPLGFCRVVVNTPRPHLLPELNINDYNFPLLLIQTTTCCC